MANLSDILKKSATLSMFTAVSAVNKQSAADPIQHKRGKFIEAATHQIEAIEAEMSGKPYIRTGQRKDKETGEKVDKQLRFKKWWLKDGNRFIVQFRYGASALFDQGLVAATIEDVLKIMDGIIEAARAGDLDSQLTNFKRGKREKKDDVKAARNNKPH